MKALIFIAHGSKKELSNKEFISMVEKIREKNNTYDFIEASFLELAEPSIEECSRSLIKKGAKELYYYPFFLNSGRHVVSDIPNIVKALEEEYKDTKFNIFEHFGKSEFIEELILKDLSINS